MEQKDFFDKTVDNIESHKTEAINTLDSMIRTSFVMDKILPILISLIVLIINLFGYKTTYIDPIENIKKIYIYVLIACTAIFIAWRIIIEHKKYNMEKILKKFKVLLIVQFIGMLIFSIVFIIWHNTYNTQKFEEFYEEFYEINYDEENKLFSLSGSKIKKTNYIAENMQAYKFFETKVLILIVCMLWNIYKIFKFMIMISKQQQIKNNDNVIFDDKTDIKVGGYQSLEDYANKNNK